jgi:hypothetical protein
MQICGSCGKKVKYIAGGYNKIYTCEAREEEFVTESGHVMRGYPLHVCNKDTSSNTNTDNKHEQSKEKR